MKKKLFCFGFIFCLIHCVSAQYSWDIQNENGKQRLLIQGGIKGGIKGKLFDKILYVKSSPDNTRFAYAAKQNGKLLMVTDFFETEYQKIEESSITFSPKGTRLVFIAKSAGEWNVIVDGKPQTKLETFNETNAAKFNLQFSPNEERLSYVVSKNINRWPNGKTVWIAVTDGKKDENTYNNILFNKFSPDNQHIVYVGDKGEWKNIWVAVVDGVEDKIEMDGILNFTPIFSPDSKHTAYGAKKADKWFMVVDGKYSFGVGCTDIGFPVFSQTCDSIAYMARFDKKWNLVVNSKIIDSYLPKHTKSKDLWWIKSVEDYFSLTQDRRCPVLINSLKKGGSNLVRKVNTHYMGYPSGFFDLEEYGVSKLEIGINYIIVSYRIKLQYMLQAEDINFAFYFNALPGNIYSIETNTSEKGFLSCINLGENYLGIVDITKSFISK
jgi:hypothetical protein